MFNQAKAFSFNQAKAFSGYIHAWAKALKFWWPVCGTTEQLAEKALHRCFGSQNIPQWLKPR
jgi:hypothetical protein